MAKLKGEEVAWYNESALGSTYPCARQILLDEGKAKNGSRITKALLDYEYAKSHRHDEELRELKDKCYRHNDCITKVEAVKKGIVFASTGQ